MPAFVSKPERGRQIKSPRAQVIEFKAPANFLQQTRETIFTRWLHRDQSELYLADQYDVRRSDIEQAVKAETRRRLGLPPEGQKRRAA